MNLEFSEKSHKLTIIKQESFNPILHKHAILVSLTYRLVNFLLNGSDYKEEFTNIIKTAKVNEYDKDLVDKKNPIVKNVIRNISNLEIKKNI